MSNPIESHVIMLWSITIQGAFYEQQKGKYQEQGRRRKK